MPPRATEPRGFGEAVEIVASSTSTNYAFVSGVQTSPPEGRRQPHRRRGEDEAFTVVEEEFEFFDATSREPFHRGEEGYL